MRRRRARSLRVPGSRVLPLPGDSPNYRNWPKFSISRLSLGKGAEKVLATRRTTTETERAPHSPRPGSGPAQPPPLPAVRAPTRPPLARALRTVPGRAAAPPSPPGPARPGQAGRSGPRAYTRRLPGPRPQPQPAGPRAGMRGRGDAGPRRRGVPRPRGAPRRLAGTEEAGAARPLRGPENRQPGPATAAPRARPAARPPRPCGPRSPARARPANRRRRGEERANGRAGAPSARTHRGRLPSTWWRRRGTPGPRGGRARATGPDAASREGAAGRTIRPGAAA
ncbi:uncharacterized protein LOC141581506 [Saimiri boliviensis]|uniref:uncharacterized protein LOC141581506 n=1 Tax=Saimiri boliviensis TaxID=27679 RepID=UPI003D76ACD3